MRLNLKLLGGCKDDCETSCCGVQRAKLRVFGRRNVKQQLWMKRCGCKDVKRRLRGGSARKLETTYLVNRLSHSPIQQHHSLRPIAGLY